MLLSFIHFTGAEEVEVDPVAADYIVGIEKKMGIAGEYQQEDKRDTAELVLLADEDISVLCRWAILRRRECITQ